MKPPGEWKVPEWCNGLPDSTLLNVRDVARVFGANAKGISTWLCPKENGVWYTSIPMPDMNRPANRPGTNVNFWRLGSIRKWIKDHQA